MYRPVSSAGIVVLSVRMHVLGGRLREEMSTGDRRSDIQLINLCPVLPGAFGGMHATDCAYEAFQKEEITKSGVTFHRVVRV